MGTLPPNISPTPEELVRFPSPRTCLLYRQGTLPDTGLGAGYLAVPALATPWYVSTPLTIWNQVLYDYPASFARSSALSGSGPYVPKQLSSTWYSVLVTAPSSRPLPYRAWFQTFCLNGHTGHVAGNAINRFGIVARLYGGTANEGLEVIASDERYENWLDTAYQTFSAEGFGVVPAGQTYQIFVGWDNGGFQGVPLHDSSGSDAWRRRNFFGVTTF